jgi:hypothetical protein
MLGVRRRGFSVTKTPSVGAVTLSGRAPTLQGTVDTGGGTPDLLFDQFTYEVGRLETDATAQAKFFNAGWDFLKREPTAGEVYIYTVERPPEYGGSLPNPSGRCLVIEAVPVLLPDGLVQTDGYLQYGPETDPKVYGQIPPRVWMQMCIYPNFTASQPSSHATRSKWIYGNGSALLGEEGFGDIIIGQESFQTLSNPSWTTSAQNFYIGNRPGYNTTLGTGANRSDVDVGQRDRLGINLANRPVLANEWTIVRTLCDTSGTQGEWHLWTRRWPSESSFTKCAEWIGGQTVNPGGGTFQWLTSANDRLGNSKFRMPTVVQNLPYWHYHQDWCVATSDSLLRTY